MLTAVYKDSQLQLRCELIPLKLAMNYNFKFHEHFNASCK